MNKRNKFFLGSIVVLYCLLARMCYAGSEIQLDAMEACFAGLKTETPQVPIKPFSASDEDLSRLTQASVVVERIDVELGLEVGDVSDAPQNRRDFGSRVKYVFNQSVHVADRIYHSYTMQNVVLPLIVTSVGGFIGFKLFAS